MEEETVSTEQIPESIKSVIHFIGELVKKQNLGPDFEKREEFWAGIHRDLRIQAQKGKLTWEQHGSIAGSLTAAKEWLSEHDFLTGLGNRRAYEQTLQEKMAESKRYKIPLSLVALDVDNFKALNDENGHLAGDDFLEKLGEIIRKNKRSSDFAARIGGDEIMIILAHTPLEGAEKFTQRLEIKIQELIAKNSAWANLSKPLRVSLGKVEWNREDSVKELKDKADQNLYEVKSLRKNG